MDLKGKGKIDFRTLNIENSNNQKNFQQNKNKQQHSNNSDKIRKEIENIIQKIKKGGYRDKEKDILRKELVSEYAKEIAENLKISTSQLRIFFNELKRIELKCETKNSENDENLKIDKLHIELYILKSKLKYKEGTREKKDEKNFKDFSYFIQENIEIIIKEEDIQSFKDFMVFFETVIGYIYGLSNNPKNKQKN
ncbi:type III-A CRISPR-associated protein Csm2 [Leptotrichia sp. OH3620_COT-345]|uniref:type III-A CRISPR-associated protein Csm2 n=1 Tax=Leptotrichia sp. OH3620_COT-345 TaxID=2491048 RepID=UPI000F64CA5B|nr:type III-A CRISPR-associated protein Csm2 [Leptotrichia sp. OH3620_COT-345]RRD40017.1 type III-A CRISPR-associated protein Csm2 [Leptotrichia sp. OH3620_COT-345]